MLWLCNIGYNFFKNAAKFIDMTPKPVCCRWGSYTLELICSKTITGSPVSLPPWSPHTGFIILATLLAWVPTTSQVLLLELGFFPTITSSLPLLVFFVFPNNFLLLFSAFLKSYVFSNPQCKFHFLTIAILQIPKAQCIFVDHHARSLY